MDISAMFIKSVGVTALIAVPVFLLWLSIMIAGGFDDDNWPPGGAAA